MAKEREHEHGYKRHGNLRAPFSWPYRPFVVWKQYHMHVNIFHLYNNTSNFKTALAGKYIYMTVWKTDLWFEPPISRFILYTYYTHIYVQIHEDIQMHINIVYSTVHIQVHL